MDISFNLVAAKCSAQMAAYQQCVTKNQLGSWASICKAEGKALSECADANVPQLADIKTTCSTQIISYQRCLDTHGHLPDDQLRDRCATSLKALWDCTERQMALFDDLNPSSMSTKNASN